jgi:DNA-binding response OmpR family regulator
LPIILCTGFKEKITKEEAKHLGIQKLILKPFAIQTLAVTIRQVLDENMQQGAMDTQKSDHDSGRL